MAFHPTSNDIWHDSPGGAADFRMKVQQAERDRAELRANELAEQIAPAKDAQERIRVWERLHALRLPRTSSHVLVKVIATQTCLTIGQVHEEQRRRDALAAKPQLSPDDGVISRGELHQGTGSATLPRDL